MKWDHNTGRESMTNAEVLLSSASLSGCSSHSWSQVIWPTVLKKLRNVKHLRKGVEKGMEPIPVFLPGESHGQRSLGVYSPWGCKELNMTEWLTHTHTHTLEMCQVVRFPESHPAQPGNHFPSMRTEQVKFSLWRGLDKRQMEKKKHEVLD